jgi:hypothetical protein
MRLHHEPHGPVAPLLFLSLVAAVTGCGADAPTAGAASLVLTARARRGGAVAYDIQRPAAAGPVVTRSAPDYVDYEVFVIQSVTSATPEPWVILVLQDGARPAPGRYPIGVATAKRRVDASLGIVCTSVCGAYHGIGAAGDELVVTGSTSGGVSGTFRFTAVGNGTHGVERTDTLVVEGHFDAPCGERGCGGLARAIGMSPRARRWLPENRP